MWKGKWKDPNAAPDVGSRRLLRQELWRSGVEVSEGEEEEEGGEAAEKVAERAWEEAGEEGLLGWLPGGRRLQGGSSLGDELSATLPSEDGEWIRERGPAPPTALHSLPSAGYRRSGHMCAPLSKIEFFNLAVPAAGPGYAERCVGPGSLVHPPLLSSRVSILLWLKPFALSPVSLFVLQVRAGAAA
jgi:hypothetical protein